MVLTCLDSGSKGNCYALESDSGEILLLDVGIPINQIKQGIGFRVSAIVGGVVTHKHSDHALSSPKLQNMGVPVYKPYEKLNKDLTLGGFRIQTFDCTDLQGNFKHTDSDGTECPIYGFVVHHKELKYPLLYATDTCFIKYRFKNLGTVILGVDYQQNLLDEDSPKAYHQLTGHMSIDTAYDFLAANNNPNLTNVILGHLSEVNADNEYFIERLNKIGLINLQIAHKGMKIKLTDIPF